MKEIPSHDIFDCMSIWGIELLKDDILNTRVQKIIKQEGLKCEVPVIAPVYLSKEGGCVGFALKYPIKDGQGNYEWTHNDKTAYASLQIRCYVWNNKAIQVANCMNGSVDWESDPILTENLTNPDNSEFDFILTYILKNLKSKYQIK